VKNEIKNTRKSKIVLFLFNVISAHFNTFVASFKKFLKTVSKGFQRNSVQFGRHVFHSVFNILKPLSFEGSFYCRKEKNPLVQDQENRVGGLSPQHLVWPEMYSLPVQNGKGHCHATRTNCNLALVKNVVKFYMLLSTCAKNFKQIHILDQKRLKL
jgi:hypothetical protein